VAVLTTGGAPPRVLLVVNPAARRGARVREKALRAFRDAGVECDAFLTERPGQAREVVHERATSYAAVFTLGGDGTAMEVVGALAGSGVPVGVLPGGTGNLVARSLGVPLDVRRAVAMLLDGDVADVDLGRLAGGGCFAFAAGIGIDSAMIEHTPAWLKRRFGVLAYVLSATRAVFQGDRFVARVTVDGRTVERRASAVMVTNFGTVLNELLTLGPDIKRDDGMLDVCVFSPNGVRDAVRVLWRLWRRDFRSDPCMSYLKGAEIRVETDPPRMAQADGELLDRTPLVIRVEPRAARMLVPAKA
jgi:YegS/Rv2252/BmrU family lipid kinase